MKKLILGVLTILLASPSFAQLGSISFPNSGKPEAQPAFLRGVGALHSFWYDEAAEAFREAQKIDPDFALAYWGEAMTYNHPIWMEVDVEAGRAALARLGANSAARSAKAVTDRERGLLEAVELLYGEGAKPERDRSYEAAMMKLARKHPEDVDLEAFLALATLGTMEPGEGDARKQVRAAAVLEPLVAAHPDHPGVLHYLIHSYDDPIHAPLGLRAARRYASVAPAAFHALHMPSHIFLQLGMWPETVASNEQSYGVSKRWVEQKRLPRSKRDLHSLQWLQYAYLQQGRNADAKALIAEIQPMEGESQRERTTRAAMLARQAIETGDWSILPAQVVPDVSIAAKTAHCAPNAYGDESALVFAMGLGAVSRGDDAAAKMSLEQLASLGSKKERVAAGTVEVMRLELEASLEASKGRMVLALDLASKAVALEESLGAPSGPPETFKPAHELLGEMLLRAGRQEDAARKFARSLLRTPNRRLSLEGAHRASGIARTGPKAIADSPLKDQEPDSRR